MSCCASSAQSVQVSWRRRRIGRPNREGGFVTVSRQLPLLGLDERRGKDELGL